MLYCSVIRCGNNEEYIFYERKNDIAILETVYATAQV